jgi:hypothetical protein
MAEVKERRADTSKARYHLAMRRLVLALPIVAALSGVAAADSFAGFSGVDRFYLVSPDRVCTPLAVKSGKATGVPACKKAAADEVAALSIKDPVAERGAKARFAATAAGRTVTIKAGDRDVVLVEWSSLDPVTRVNAVYGSTYADMVAVEIAVRRAGREAVDVVGFDLGRGHAQTGDGGTGVVTPVTPPVGPDVAPVTPVTPVAPPTKADKAMTAALTKARAASGAKAIAAWTKVLALDGDSAEAQYGLAVAHMKLKKPADAIAALQKLAISTRSDAIEYRVAARFDKAFAAVRDDATFRAAVGLDRPAATMFERVMGLGGNWEQVQTCGVNPQVTLALARDKKFALAIRNKCPGNNYGWKFKGRWLVDDQGLVLVFPNKERAEEHTRCQVTASGDEDAITCPIDADLEFTVLPVRR